MELVFVLLVKFIVFMAAVFPMEWQISVARSKLRRHIAQSRWPFVSGRSDDRWEFPSRALCALRSAWGLASAGLGCMWILFGSPYPMLDASSVFAGQEGLVEDLAIIAILFGFPSWLLQLYYFRIEFTRLGVTCPSPRRFLRGRLPWHETATCTTNLETGVLTISTPSETITLSAESAGEMAEAAARFGGSDHPVAVALHETSERLNRRRPRLW